MSRLFNFIKLTLFMLVSAAAAGFLFVPGSSNLEAASETSSGAIAVRVLENPDHYSAARWYKENFSASGQPVSIDGYNGIRDGRTIYVNAANISGNNLYTNIYLFSYDQKAGDETIATFNQLMAHLKFNVNISGFGRCGGGGKYCLSDSECSGGIFCSGIKAKIARDTERMENLADIAAILENYYDENGNYPLLTSGSYLPGKTVSVWPSWKNAFSFDLGVSSLPVDPVNALGACASNYNSVTCWNENTKQFGGSFASDGSLAAPSGSLVYSYSSVSGGSGYRLCAKMESGYFAGGKYCLSN